MPKLSLKGKAESAKQRRRGELLGWRAWYGQRQRHKGKYLDQGKDVQALPVTGGNLGGWEWERHENQELGSGLVHYECPRRKSLKSFKE